MAGPQFLTPQPVFSSRPRRRFTLAQANRALPLVRRVVDDIVQTREQATQLQLRLESSGAKDQKRIQQDLDVAIDKLHAYLDELTEIGITPTALARQLKVPPNRITQIVQGKRAITGDTALRLAHWFGTSPQFWLNLQSSYEIRIAEKEAGALIRRLPTRAA